MKPIFLQMQAFGPFAGKEAIRFSDLGESPLFLINGPTGSGKTTILDAICYALYGSTTGNDRDARDMRCQQSDPDTLTEVVFEFSLGSSSYRINRSPDQERPKKRGEGFTPHKSCADLYKLGPDGTVASGELLVEKKISDVNDYIKSLTGLNVEQFRQVMVLPQGQFRKLLMADSKDKQKIFQSLFQTSIYYRIEERLKEESKEIRDAVEHLKSVVRNILDTGGVQSEPELAEKIEAAGEQLQELKNDSDKAHAVWATAEKALHDANKLQKDFDELEKIKLKETELKAQSAQVQVDKARAKQAHGAEKLMPILVRVTEAERGLATTKTEITAAGSALASAEALLSQAEVTLQLERAREAQRTAASAKVHELKSYAGKAEALLKAKSAVQRAQASEASAEAETTRSLLALDEHLKGEVQTQEGIEALKARVASAEGIELKLHKLQETLSARRHLAMLQSNLSAAQKSLAASQQLLSEAQSSRSAADETLKRLRRAWHLGQAALLARQLEEGVPCPVCGSAEHPQPATPSQEAVSEEQLECAAEALETQTRQMIRASGKVSTGEQTVKSIQLEIDKAQASLGAVAQQSSDELARELAEASKQANSLAADRKALVVQQNALSAHVEHTAVLRKVADDSKSALADTQKALTKAQTLFELSEQALPAAYQEVGRLEQELATARETQQSLEKALEQAQSAFQTADKARGEAQTLLKELQRNESKTEQNLASARADWAQALAASGFNTEQELRQAYIAVDELEALDRKNTQYDEAVLQARTARETIENQLEGKTLADLPALAAVEEQTRSARDQALASWRTADQNMNRLHDTQKNYAAKQAQMAQLDARYAVVGTLADVACGLKGSKVSLQRYVLGVLLDDVLVQSTQRLMKMSAGRYELRRKLDPGRKNRASGLDLEVYDDYSGESRAVSTLSGGESFMAALSLALGLSDVVQAQTGGIQLDTLFVDEGFGTLDSEALELAVSTLMDLQQAGRMVGIISHVSELREQMDVRIDLTKSSHGGSSLKVVSAVTA